MACCWMKPPTLWDHGVEYGGTLDVKLGITLPPWDGRVGVCARERVVVRLGF
jgi:hypothetical protein